MTSKHPSGSQVPSSQSTSQIGKQMETNVTAMHHGSLTRAHGALRLFVALSTICAVLAGGTMSAAQAVPGGGIAQHDGGGGPAETTEMPTDAPIYRGDLESSQGNLAVLGSIGSDAAERLALGAADGSGVTVAVLGDGVWSDHPDLQGRVLDGYDVVNAEPVIAGTKRTFEARDSFTGTFAAGLIAGNADREGIRGLSPAANILPVLVNGKVGTEDRYVAAGITWAQQQGAKLILVIGNENTVSAQGDESLTCKAVTAARREGVLTFTAASNASRYTTTTYLPSRCADIVPVAAVSATFGETGGESNDVAALFSAPGTNLVSAFPDMSFYPYSQSSSSDWAAAQAVGVAAAVLSGRPTLTPVELLTRLQETATDIGAVGLDSDTGAGILDVAAAIGARQPRSRAELEKAATQVSTPRVVEITRDDNGKTSIGWEPPTGVAVTSYNVVVTSWDGQRWVTDSYPVAGDQVRHVLDVDVYGEAIVAVDAVVSSGTRSGFPSASITTKRYVRAPHVDAKITSVSGAWTDRGLKVSVERNTLGLAELWNIVILDGFTQQPIKFERDINANSDSYTVYFAAGDQYREMPVVAMAWIGGTPVSKLVWPQYRLDAEGYAAGFKHGAVSGRADFACVDTQRDACEGTILKVVDSRTKKVLATTKVLSDLTFSVVFPWKASMLKVQVIGPKGVISKPIDKSLTWRK